jgi:hypothetical protein
MYLHKYLPPAPQLPRLLWLTGGALLLVLLSYGFRSEIWPGHPAAGKFSLVPLPVLLLVGLLQLHNILRQWPAAVPGPGWLRPVVRTGVILVQAGTALLLWLMLLAVLIVLAVLA